MTSLAFSLTIESGELLSDVCSKCAKEKKLAEEEDPPRTVKTSTALYSLRQGAQLWRLCTNHAASAAHTLPVKHPVFNPEGKSLHLPKE